MKALVLAFLASCFVVAGCANSPSAHECASGIVCPDPLQCAAVQAVCISNACGNGIVDPGETCDDGNIVNGDGCSADCKSAEACGDGVTNTEAGELCDDGNTVSGDGCSADCKSLETCGNGITDTAKGEVCDDGNTHNGTCGDGHVCDSNADCTVGTCTPDGCASDCKSNETCGNGVKDLGEVCDDGHAPGGCEDDCQHGVGCGNGVLDSGEQCDDGNSVTTDDCTNGCTINVCGDGVIDSTGVTHHETCDPGTGGVALETSGCNIDCTTPSCGDGKVNLHFKPDGTHVEQCDLGTIGTTNQNADTAACTANCQINVCGDGKKSSTEDCDLGAANGTSSTVGSCDSQCHLVGCGNGIVDPGEQCDPRTTFTSPPNPTETATCDSDCTAVYCGDGKTNIAVHEACDQGVNNGQPCTYSATPGATCVRCAADCLTVDNTKPAPYCGDGNTDLGNEVCDQGAANGTACPYATSCQRCNSACTALTTQQGPFCGDTVIQTADNEQCEGSNLNGKTCADLGYASGTPTCYPSTDPVNGCRFNVFSCVPTCGNGTVEQGEQCDSGTGHPDTSTCDGDCTKPSCGDSHINTQFKPDGTNPEQCDNGLNNTNDPNCAYNTPCGARCSTTCQTFTPHDPTCGDGTIDNGHETCDDSHATEAKIDCGYPTMSPCVACHACAITPLPPEFCGDGVKNGPETDLDCGGATCDGSGHKCADTKSCLVNLDCVSGFCNSGHVCATPTCSDSAKNGSETDTDCGGATCDGMGDRCADTKACLVANDCTSGVCDGTNHCAAAACNDNVQNGSETDKDCGGATCDAASDRCADTKKCAVDNDCTNGYCNVGVSPHVCATPTCLDGVQNGSETGVDCGTLTCGGCPGDPCTVPTDCHSASCGAGTAGKCD